MLSALSFMVIQISLPIFQTSVDLLGCKQSKIADLFFLLLINNLIAKTLQSISEIIPNLLLQCYILYRYIFPYIGSLPSQKPKVSRIKSFSDIIVFGVNCKNPNTTLWNDSGFYLNWEWLFLFLCIFARVPTFVTITWWWLWLISHLRVVGFFVSQFFKAIGLFFKILIYEILVPCQW
jgi:hypothetical protein